MENYVEDKRFDREDFTLVSLPKGEYEGCSFVNCNFSESDLSGVQFEDCLFTDCNLSLAKLTKTAFRKVTFAGCKMLGLQFQSCNPFNFSFMCDGCMLNHSSFYQMKLKQTTFKNTQLCEVDFGMCDLTGSIFDRCDLAGAMFEDSILEKVDFRTAFHYSIDPIANRIKKARFSLSGIAGLLDRYDIEIEN
jgi:uncharacterized protein YjbI with pentapeptide repeats